MAKRMSPRWFAWVVVPAMALVPAVIAWSPARADLVQSVAGGKGSIDWTSGQIKVTGSGAPPERGNPAQRRLLALRAATVDGYRQLAEVLNGVKVDSETTVKDYVVESDVIKTQVSALVKGARQLGEPRYLSDGAVEVDLVIQLYGDGNVAEIIHPEKPRKPPVETRMAPVDVSREGFTGVIIDCQGLGAQPAMSPAIMDTSGGEIYLGKHDMGESFADFVIEHGIVGYAKSRDEAKRVPRVGNKPLLLRASRISGKFKADAVLDNASAQRLLGAEDANKVLTNAKVVFVL